MKRLSLYLAAGLLSTSMLIVACAPGAPASPTVVTVPTVASPQTTPLAAPTVAPGNSPAVTIVPTIAAPTTAAPTAALPTIALPTAAPTGAAPLVGPTFAPTAAAPTIAPPAAGTPSAACTNAATFVADVTIPDGTAVTPGQTFTKTWRVRNSGTCTWGSDYTLAFIRGTAMATTTSLPVPTTAPGATADLTVQMTAPTASGSYSGFWDLRAPNGTRMTQVWVIVNVGATPAAAPTLAPGAPTSTPGAAACTNRAAFVADVTIPDGAVVTPGQQFVKTWRVQNTGTCTWGQGYTLAFQRGTAMTTTTTVPVPATAPGANADLTVQMTAPAELGNHAGFWDLLTPNGIRIMTMWVIIRVGAAPAAAPTLAPGAQTPVPGAACTNVSNFVADVTIPDGAVVAPGQAFNKTWRVRNSGTCTWGAGYTLVFVSGEAMTATTSVSVPETAPGGTADLTVQMTAPTAPGNYTGFWELRAPNGARMLTMWVIVRVTSGPAAAPPLVPGAPGTSGRQVVSPGSQVFPPPEAVSRDVIATGVQMDPDPTAFREPTAFRVTVFNQTPGSQTIRWFVKVYECTRVPCPEDDLRNAVGETAVTEVTVPPGTTVLDTGKQWLVGPGSCTFVAVPFFEPQGGLPSPLPQADGSTLFHGFRMPNCATDIDPGP